MQAIQTKETYPVLGIDISPLSKNEFYHSIDQRLCDSDPDSPPFFIVTVNPEIVMESIIDNEFKKILNSSSMNTADGAGICWAIDYLYDKNVERITGSDSVKEISKICAKHSQPLFLYGAAPGVADKAASILMQDIPGLNVVGTHSPETAVIPFENLPEDVQDRLYSASVVFVALGAPSQEKWISRNLHHLPNCKLIIGIGGSFDFIAGTVKRAPAFFQNNRLEWFYRLYLEPSRWKRMMKLPAFAMNIILLRSYMSKMNSQVKT